MEIRQLKEGNATIAVMELLFAIERTDELFKQYEVNERKVAAIEKNLRQTGLLLINPVVATLNGTNYVVSGRHRAEALCNLVGRDYKVEVDHVNVDSEKQLLELVIAYNSSRSMSAAEKLHLNAQLEGITSAVATDDNEYGDLVPVTDNIKSDKQVKSACVAMFVEAVKPVPPSAAKTAGTELFKYVACLKTVSSRKLTLDPAICIERMLEFASKFVEEYDMFEHGNKARNVKTIVERTIHGINPEQVHAESEAVDDDLFDEYFGRVPQPQTPTEEVIDHEIDFEF